ncbi:MAG: ferric reductase-like transmembrane domain-containing protein [Phycisphaerae bacterium]|nr:ferric reductase-like transmembrane domain-containing protein [Phycisphaerae bacterium]
MKAAKTRHVFSNNTLQWIITGFIYLAFFAFFIWYHDVRGKPFTLWTTEKCTAIASVYCLGLALSLGPLSRFFSSFDRLLPYRRTLGLTAAFMAIPHFLLVIFYLPYKFPENYSEKYFLSWFVAHWFTFVMGILTFALFMVIVRYSFPSGIRKLGTRKWMVLQKFSNLLMVMVVLHLLSMGKIPKNWIAWVETRDWPLPPGSFATMCLCVSVLLLKVVDLIVHGDSLARQPAAEENTV